MILNVGLKYGVYVKQSVFLFSLLIIIFIDNSSSRNVDWQLSYSCNILLTLYATSFTMNYFFKCTLYSTAEEETIRDVFINRYRTIVVYLAPGVCIEDFLQVFYVCK